LSAVSAAIIMKLSKHLDIQIHVSVANFNFKSILTYQAHDSV
jgi:hypothetical protein